MRRLVLFLSVAVVASVVPGAVGVGNPAAPPGPAAADAVGPALAVTSGPTLLAPPVDRPGPARLDPAVLSAARTAAPGGVLDLIVSLERPAQGTLRRTLARLGLWEWVFDHVPAAAVRLPVARLGDLARLEGVLGVYLNEPLQWQLKESAELLNTKRAWNDLGVTGEGVTVAILDTGIDFTHPDLAPAMRGNVKLIGFGDPGPLIPLEGVANSDTTSGHGTHVAGDVAARGTASDGEYRGTAPGAGLVGIGAGDGLNMFLVLEGLDWTMANRERLNIRVINNSWGTQFEPFDPYDPVHGATRTLAAAGVVVVFANGNDGTEMSMNPYATAPWVLAVAAGDKEGKLASFSSHGIEADTVGLGFAKVDVAGETRRPLSMGLYHPAITVTGDNVVSTRANNTIAPLTGLPNDLQGIPPDRLPYYTTLSGTSMASPEAAGLAALVLEAAPELDPLQVRQVLQITARPMAEPFHAAGYGYADAGAAVELAQRLHGLGAAAIRAELDRLQSARDEKVLAGLAHPSHTYAWTDLAPLGVGTRAHQVTVPAGTERLKVISSGGTVPFVGSASYQITVTDAEGKEVGSNADSSPSGATILDLNLAETPDVAFGEWTVEIFALGSLGTPTSGADDFVTKRLMNLLVSVFGPQTGACRGGPEFVPGDPLTYRFQDDDASGVAHPTRPDYTHVGVIADAGLGQRTPARNLAGSFGQASTFLTEARFTSGALAGPVTLGGPAGVELWVQGPSEAVQGLVSGQLVAVSADGKTETALAEIPADAVLSASTTEPVRTQVPLELLGPATVPAGSRLALAMTVSFFGTSGHTLFFDSDEFASGLRLTTGRMAEPEGCPA